MKTGRPLLLPERLDTLDLASIMEIENSLSSFTSNNKNFTGTLKFAKVYFAKGYFVVDSPKLQPANVSLYTVYGILIT